MDSEKTPESTLVDHSFVAKPAPTKLWPLALGTCAIFLTVGSVVTGYSHFEGLKAEIKRLSGELVYSRKQVAELIAENAILNKKLATTGSDSTPTPPSPAATGLTGSTSYEDERAGEAFLTDEIGVGGFDRKNPSEELEEKSPSEVPSADLYEGGLENATMDGSDIQNQTDDSLISDEGAIVEHLTGSDQWSITVGTFADSKNKDRLVANLERDAYTVSVNPITRDGRSMVRVVVLGFSTPEQAEEAATAIEKKYRTGLLRVNRDTMQDSNSLSETPAKDDLGVTSTPSGSSNDAGMKENGNALLEAAAPQPPKVVRSGWFIYVATFENSNAASKLAQELVKDGYNTKVAVEYRSGNLYYRVQVVGIGDRSSGEALLQGLVSRGDLPNVQLRHY